MVSTTTPWNMIRVHDLHFSEFEGLEQRLLCVITVLPVSIKYACFRSETLNLDILHLGMVPATASFELT